MNLIETPWLPFRRPDGTVVYDRPAGLASPEYADLSLVRADFQGAAWQFLIGLLQTAFAPRNISEWADLWERPPTVEELDTAFAPYRDAFVLDGDGPRFMQDLDSLADRSEGPVASLLIEAPGAQTLKLNADHFIKRGLVERICPDCAAMALFTMQINAPSGGKGYRTGIRGGGPLTTLVLPHDPEATFWQRLWLNVLDCENHEFSAPDPEDGNVFPWLTATRESDCEGSEIWPDDVHPLHVYWAMPRRFRLQFEKTPCHCDLCGRKSETSVVAVRAKNYGNNYAGPWIHPLTPYRRDPKKPAEPPLSIKGQPGGIGYRHWESLVLEDREERGQMPARVVHDYAARKAPVLDDIEDTARRARLWVFGYDMDNMKARGWYASEMPLLVVEPERQDQMLAWVEQLTAIGGEVAGRTQSAVRSAWFSRPKDVKGDFSHIGQRVFEATEADFYICLFDLWEAICAGEEGVLPEPVAKRWYTRLRDAALQVFDDLSLTGDTGALDMKRIVQARNDLNKWLARGKPMQELQAAAGWQRKTQKNRPADLQA
ncbi:MAG TPA: type I-E CRISPR-associated protein Cse1/CasA [Halothiobacillus sp.]|nr:type I-E CRISPR-associated protein Cse1/CasA [Halothiobacillus sp.]